MTAGRKEEVSISHTSESGGKKGVEKNAFVPPSLAKRTGRKKG